MTTAPNVATTIEVLVNEEIDRKVQLHQSCVYEESEKEEDVEDIETKP